MSKMTYLIPESLRIGPMHNIMPFAEDTFILELMKAGPDNHGDIGHNHIPDSCIAFKELDQLVLFDLEDLALFADAVG